MEVIQRAKPPKRPHLTLETKKSEPHHQLGDMSFPPIRLEEDPTPLFCPHPKGPLAKKIMSPRGDGDQIHLSRVFEWENNQPHDTSRGTGHNSRGAQQQEEPSLSSSTITIPNAIETPYEIRSREESECGDSCEDDDSYFESRISSEYLLIPTARSSMEWKARSSDLIIPHFFIFFFWIIRVMGALSARDVSLWLVQEKQKWARIGIKNGGTHTHTRKIKAIENTRPLALPYTEGGEKDKKNYQHQ